MKPSRFLSQVDHGRIVAAIRAAEARSRGELRVHVSHADVDDPQRAAARQFEKLGMTATAERNGVLIFIAPRSRSFAVIGDQGVHAKCAEHVWREIASEMARRFSEGRFTDGIVEAVGRVGAVLAGHFPRVEGRADSDELPDEVSED
jgi:uncharacterized membrane protein